MLGGTVCINYGGTVTFGARATESENEVSRKYMMTIIKFYLIMHYGGMGMPFIQLFFTSNQDMDYVGETATVEAFNALW